MENFFTQLLTSLISLLIVVIALKPVIRWWFKMPNEEVLLKAIDSAKDLERVAQGYADTAVGHAIDDALRDYNWNVDDEVVRRLVKAINDSQLKRE